MIRAARSHGLLIFALPLCGLLVSLLLAGCSDEGDGGGSGSKPAVSAKTTITSSTTVTKSQTADSGKSEVKMETKSETKTEMTAEPKSTAVPAAAPAAKPEAKPPEGKVEVKAEPDEPPVPVTPPATAPAKPADKPTSRNDYHSLPRSDAMATSLAADGGAPPKFSTIASAKDLANELDFLVGDAEKAVVSEDEYKSQVEGRFARDGNTIALLAIALGLHDEDNPLKARAPAISEAAQKLADAKDYETTKKAVANFKAAIESGSGGGELKWEKVATLKNLMKDEVPYVNKKLKDGLRHFKKRAKEASANAAALALIAENAKLYVADTKKPSETEKWNEFAGQFRAAAGEVAAKVHAGDEAGANAAMDKVTHSCEECHAVFNSE